MLNIDLMEKSNSQNLLSTSSSSSSSSSVSVQTSIKNIPSPFSSTANYSKLSSSQMTNSISYEEEENENDDILSISEINRLNKIREEALKRSEKYKNKININTFTNNNEINNSTDNISSSSSNNSSDLSDEYSSDKENKEIINPNNQRIFNFVHPFFYYQNEPLIIIGPHLKYYIFIFTLVSFFSIIIFSMKKNNNNEKIWMKILFVLAYLLFAISYTLLMLKNPGVPKDKNNFDLDDLIRNSRQCKICQCIVYKDMLKNTEHCQECDVCIENLEKHNKFATKCVGKRNKILFKIWIFSLPTFLVIALLYLIF